MMNGPQGSPHGFTSTFLRSPRALRALLASAVALLTAIAITLAAPAQAEAQEIGEIQVEQFEPLPDQHTNILNVATADLLGHLGYSFGAFIHYVSNPLRVVRETDDGDEEIASVIEGQVKGEIWAGLGLSEWFDIGVVVPLIFYQTGEDVAAIGIDGASDFALQDIRIVPRFKLLPREWAGGFGIALEGIFYIPVGDKDSFNSESGFRAEPRLILDYKHDVGFEIALNAGYLIRESQTINNIVNDDVVRLAVGIAAPLGVDGLQLIGSAFGAIQTVDSLDPGNLNDESSDFRSSPWEALGGIRYTAPFGLHASVGAGSGLNNAVGAPEFRVFGSIGFLPLDDDYDNDGIVNEDDQCPERPEDKDDFQDEDGCPDDDNDEDGIKDPVDECRDTPEDPDDFQDEDGCPDPDNDEDGILDEDDQCPLEKEDVDGFQDEDGCPDTDNDGDGILDADDSCPMEKEDVDGFEDEDGCPDPDNDDDKILDENDKCPNEAEVYNGFEDEDGCPDKGRVIIEKKKITILDKVYFDTNKTTIKPESFPILDQVAATLANNDQITLVRIEGHTDSRGKDSFNMELSEGRAASVRDYLIEKGIAADRLQSQGYGETKPIDTNKTRAGRANNRRVEFTILEIDGKPLPKDEVEGPQTIEETE